MSGAVGMRPRWGLRPKSAQLAAGMRIDPPPTEPSAAGAGRGAGGRPAPPLPPPDVRRRSHGLRVTPNVGDSVHGVVISSGTFVLPSTIAPAARSRQTTSASAGAGSGSTSQPYAVVS